MQVVFLSKLSVQREHYRDFLSIEIECCAYSHFGYSFFLGCNTQPVCACRYHKHCCFNGCLVQCIYSCVILFLFTMVLCLETKYLFNNRTFFLYVFWYCCCYSLVWFLGVILILSLCAVLRDKVSFFLWSRYSWLYF